MNDDFYIGYLPRSPDATARFTRRVVVALAVSALVVGAGLAVTLPYLGKGRFEFGQARDFAGTVSCDLAHQPHLVTAEADRLLVALGKHGAPLEVCGAAGTELMLNGTLIERDGRGLIELSGLSQPAKSGLGATGSAAVQATPLGRFTLAGEIVDSKCYFGVMNPGEGRVHRACAALCLRGGVPAVFVVRDRHGATAHLLLAGPEGTDLTTVWPVWTGESVEATGEVVRQGRWLVWRIDPASLRLARARP